VIHFSESGRRSLQRYHRHSRRFEPARLAPAYELVIADVTPPPTEPAPREPRPPPTAIAPDELVPNPLALPYESDDPWALDQMLVVPPPVP
jgi:hypothetical protein